MPAEKVSTPSPQKPPFPVSDRGAFVQKAFVACGVVNVPTYECVAYSIAYDRIETVHIPVSEMGADHNGRPRYYVDGNHVSGGPAHLAKTHLQWLRNKALESGATPDAIRLLGRATTPFTKKEEANMAEKLKAKNTPAKADKAGLKAGAKAAAVGGKGGVKPKGNAAALAKAREAKGPDLRKIKVLIKKPEARDGTFRAIMLKDLLASKTVQEFKDKDKQYNAACVSFAVKAGIISVS